MADGLVAFLTARLDEDEQGARDAQTAPDVRWAAEYQHVVNAGVVVRCGNAIVEESVAEVRSANYPAAAHIARHDPARVLVDVAAKRRIIDEHRPWSEAPGSGWPDPACAVCVSMVMDEDQGGNRFLDLEHVAWPCPTLRLLALPFADHPDYRDEWRPE